MTNSDFISAIVSKGFVVCGGCGVGEHEDAWTNIHVNATRGDVEYQFLDPHCSSLTFRVRTFSGHNRTQVVFRNYGTFKNFCDLLETL